MKNKPRVLIYDDEVRFVEGLESRLNAVPEFTRAFRVERLSDGDFVKVLQDFKMRQAKFRENAEWDEEVLPLDDAAIFVVDYDLLNAPQTQSVLTGEEFAYLARVFSSCQLVIELNQFGSNTFDLRLRGYPDSFADLNLGDKQIDSAYLWGGKKIKFAPWYWPNIGTLLHDFGKRVADMEAGLKSEEPICKILGLPEEVFRQLSRSLSGFLGVHGDGNNASDVSKVTVFEFLTESRNALRPKDAAALKGHRRALEKGTHRHAKILARVAAARLSKWVECLLLPGQDIVVDAPHLVSRYPSLLKTKTPTLGAFDKTAQIAEHDKLGIDTERIQDYRLNKTHWYSRPLWLWTGLSEDQRISEVDEPWTIRKKVGDLVFCEDTSSFFEREHCREFYADTDSPFAKRFAKIIAGVDYKPRVWFS